MRENEKITKIKGVLSLYRRRIPFAFLFGSAAYGKHTVLSDIDLGIFFSDLSEDGKTEIEHTIGLLFEEPVHIIRLEDEDISADLRLSAVEGVPVMLNDKNLLNTFILSLIHRAEEERRIFRKFRLTA